MIQVHAVAVHAAESARTGQSSCGYGAAPQIVDSAAAAREGLGTREGGGGSGLYTSREALAAPFALRMHSVHAGREKTKYRGEAAD